MTILFFFAVTLAILYILMPLYRHKFSTLIPEDATFSYLREKKETSYLNLKDLDFDYSIGKISKEDYERIRIEFKMEAAQVMGEADTLNQWINQEIKKRLRQENQILPQKCPSCQKIPPLNAKFCPECGGKI
ncbi:MAG: zinc ribbon domain-containing protein [Chlamydiae bacterium]|nr:zinc ribbon domain-containing protein [Chlamydiota bacterium]